MIVDYGTAADEGNCKMNAGQTISVRGVLGSEVIAVQIPDGAGDWEPLYEENELVTLTATNMQITAYGNTLIKIVLILIQGRGLVNVLLLWLLLLL